MLVIKLNTGNCKKMFIFNYDPLCNIGSCGYARYINIHRTYEEFFNIYENKYMFYIFVTGRLLRLGHFISSSHAEKM